MDQKVVAVRSAPPPNPIRSGAEYIESLRGRKLKFYLMGEPVEELVDDPIIRPSMDLTRSRKPTICKRRSRTGFGLLAAYRRSRANRFLHVSASTGNLVMQNKMQRRLGQLTGTCFQRCVGMDTLNSLHSVTYDLDEKYGTDYHVRFKQFFARMQSANLVIGGAMTDVKGDRSKSPSQRSGPGSLPTRGPPHTRWRLRRRHRKAHQTGCLNSHWLLVMPTMRLEAADKDYAIVGAIPVDAEGITYIYGRPILRHAQRRRRRHQLRQCPILGSRSDDYLRECLHSAGTSLSRPRVRIRLYVGRTVHLLPPPQLRLQDGCRRRPDRGRCNHRGL